MAAVPCNSLLIVSLARSKLGLVLRFSPPPPFLPPFPFPPSPFLLCPFFPFLSSLPFPPSYLHRSLSLRSRSPLFQLEGLGECYKLPLQGLGQSPTRNRFWCILALKSDIG